MYSINEYQYMDPIEKAPFRWNMRGSSSKVARYEQHSYQPYQGLQFVDCD